MGDSKFRISHKPCAAYHKVRGASANSRASMNQLSLSGQLADNRFIANQLGSRQRVADTAIPANSRRDALLAQALQTSLTHHHPLQTSDHNKVRANSSLSGPTQEHLAPPLSTPANCSTTRGAVEMPFDGAKSAVAPPAHHVSATLLLPRHIHLRIAHLWADGAIVSVECGRPI